jgi:fatty-acyl-CoA synthase
VHLGAPWCPAASPTPTPSRPRRADHNPHVDAEDIVCLLFTGGTTGTPKAAQISYRMIAWNTLNTLVHEVQRGDVTLTHTPMFHTGGLFVHTLPLLTVGGTAVIMRKWTAEDMLALIERERVTLLFCVPTQYQMMLDAPALRDDLVRQSVRFLTSGGAPLPVPIVHAYRAGPRRRVQAGLRHDRVRPRHLLDAPRIRRVRRPAASASPTTSSTRSVVDEAGAPVEPARSASWCSRAPAAAPAISQMPRRPPPRSTPTAGSTPATSRAPTPTASSSSSTARRTCSSPAARTCTRSRSRRSCTTTPPSPSAPWSPLPDPQWGEVGRAVVALRPGASATPDELLTHCRAHLARYKIPRHLELRDSLPLSPAGKILKRAL